MSDSASRRKLARAAESLADAARSALPPMALMTDDERLPDPVAAARALPRGSMVIVRSRDPSHRRALTEVLLPVARRRNLVLLVAGDAALALSLGADGVHLPEARIGEAASLKAHHRMLVTASAHSLASLRKAAFVDALFLSPVFPTESHPGRRAIGPVRASAMARLARKPVYALGGVTAENAGRLSGFAGIAAIGGISCAKCVDP